MDPHSLVGMTGYSTVNTKFDRYGHGTPASLEATYMRVLSEVGGSHHLVHHEGENCARIVGNDELAPVPVVGRSRPRRGGLRGPESQRHGRDGVMRP